VRSGPHHVGIALLGVVGGICAGFQGPLTRLSFGEGGNATSTAVIRSSIILVLGGTALAVQLVRRHRAAAARAAPWGAMLAVGCAQAYTGTAFYFAIERMPLATVVLVVYTYPALTVLGSWLLGWSRLRAISVGAIVATTAGAALIVGGPSGDLDALALALSAGIALATTSIFLFTQVALRDTGPALMYAVTATCLSALTLCAVPLLPAPTFPNAAGVAYVAIIPFAMLAAVFLGYRTIARLGSATASLLMTTELITAVAAAALILGDRLAAGTAVGGAILLGGVVLAILSSRSRPARAARVAGEELTPAGGSVAQA
jgi:drug/metabolite transporter (DMT)-like permease